MTERERVSVSLCVLVRQLQPPPPPNFFFFFLSKQTKARNPTKKQTKQINT